jgi:hypothetical protein
MPQLLNQNVALTYTSGTNKQFLGLGGAQPYLGLTPSTTTGFTLVSNPLTGQPYFVSTLGGAYFNNSVITAQTTNTDLTLTSTGTGRLVLTGNVVINANNLQVTTATFQDLTITNAANFVSTTTNVNMSASLYISKSLDVGVNAYIHGSLEVYDNVTFEPNNGNVNIRPTGLGQVVIYPDSIGYIDNMAIGQYAPASGRFNILTATTFVIQNTNFVDLTVSNLTVTNNLVVSNFFAPTFSANTATINSSLSAPAIYENGNQVLTNVVVNTGPGLSSTVNISGVTATIALTNTGVTSLIAGSDIYLSSGTGNITIADSSTLQSVTNRGATTTNVVYFNNATPAGSTTGSVVVTGGVYASAGIFADGLTTFRGTGNQEYTIRVAGGATGAQLAIGTSGVSTYGIESDVLNAAGSGFAKLTQTASEFHFNVANSSGIPVQTDALVVNANGYVIINSSQNASNQTTGALQVVGGVGVGGNLYAANIFSNGFQVTTSSSLTFEYHGSILGTAGTVNLDRGFTATVVGGVITIDTVAEVGVTSITAGTDISITTSTGAVTVNDTSTLQTVTSRGSTTNNAVNITNGTNATTSTTGGALHVSGGVGIGQDLWVGGSIYDTNAGSPYYEGLLFTPNVTLSATPPANPRIGDFWYDSNSYSYQFIQDGTSTFWIQIGAF